MSARTLGRVVLLAGAIALIGALIATDQPPAPMDLPAEPQPTVTVWITPPLPAPARDATPGVVWARHLEVTP